MKIRSPLSILSGATFGLQGRRALLAIALTLPTAAIAVACSSSTTPVAKPTPTETCPTTVDNAVGPDNACANDGFVCGIGYPCGSFNQQTQCVCTAGAFVCTDATGVVLTAGVEPTCKPFNEVDAGCPATEMSAQGGACKAPGALCYYAGVTCPGQKQPALDSCQCVGSGNDGGLAFVCEEATCDPVNHDDAGH